MMNYFQNNPWVAYWMPFTSGFALGFGVFVFSLILLWSLVWKGLALWKAAREGSKSWFVILLIINTLGILEILYIYIFSKKPGLKE